jgi:hypothetical protein
MEEEDEGTQGAVAVPGTVRSHKLHSAWVLWFDTPSAGAGGGGGGGGKKTAFGSNLRRVATMESIEEFWAVFNNVLCASKLPQGSNYHLFRAGIEPKWEDKANEQGGKVVCLHSLRARLSQFPSVGPYPSEGQDASGVDEHMRRSHRRAAGERVFPGQSVWHCR